MLGIAARISGVRSISMRSTFLRTVSSKSSGWPSRTYSRTSTAAVVSSSVIRDLTQVRPRCRICSGFSPGSFRRLPATALASQPATLFTAARCGPTRLHHAAQSVERECTHVSPALISGTANDSLFNPNRILAGLPSNFFVVNPGKRGGAFVFTNGGETAYDGLTIEFRRRFAKGLLVQANYTFSKALSNMYASNDDIFDQPATLREESGQPPWRDTVRHHASLQDQLHL